MSHQELLAAYARAVYRVDTAPAAIFLRVGEASPDLARWLAARGARRFAFLSAANPGSVALADDENRRRHQRLLERLRDSRLEVIAGESYEAADGGWREASLLVAGLARAAAIALAKEFGQVALLVGESGGPVELVLTSESPKKS